MMEPQPSTTRFFMDYGPWIFPAILGPIWKFLEYNSARTISTPSNSHSLKINSTTCLPANNFLRGPQASITFDMFWIDLAVLHPYLTIRLVDWLFCLVDVGSQVESPEQLTKKREIEKGGDALLSSGLAVFRNGSPAALPTRDGEMAKHGQTVKSVQVLQL